MIMIFAVAEETGLKNSGLNETRTQTSAMQTRGPFLERPETFRVTKIPLYLQ